MFNIRIGRTGVRNSEAYHLFKSQPKPVKRVLHHRELLSNPESSAVSELEGDSSFTKT